VTCRQPSRMPRGNQTSSGQSGAEAGSTGLDSYSLPPPMRLTSSFTRQAEREERARGLCWTEEGRVREDKTRRKSNPDKGNVKSRRIWRRSLGSDFLCAVFPDRATGWST